MSHTSPSSACDKGCAPLPVEILRAIISHLAKPQLARCMSSSRTLNLLAAPLLYKHVYAELRGSDPTTGMFRHIPRDRTNQADKDVDLLAPVIPPPSTAHSTLPDRFSYTTHFTIESHHECGEYAPIHMPDLAVLRLGQMPTRDIIELCQGGADRRLTCPIVRHLRPPRIILGGTGTGLCGNAEGMWCAATPFPPPFVKDIIFFVGDDDDWVTPTFLSRLPSTLERFTMVLEPRDREAGGKWTRDELPEDEDEEYSREDPIAFFAELALPCQADAQVVEIVGLELLDEEWLGGLTVADAEEEVGDIAEMRMLCSGVPRDEVARKRDRIVFLTREKFDRREGKDMERFLYGEEAL